MTHNPTEINIELPYFKSFSDYHDADYIRKLLKEFSGNKIDVGQFEFNSELSAWNYFFIFFDKKNVPDRLTILNGLVNVYVRYAFVKKFDIEGMADEFLEWVNKK